MGAEKTAFQRRLRPQTSVLNWGIEHNEEESAWG
jgi:hypothetical protein